MGRGVGEGEGEGMKHVYYLHTNGELIHKNDSDEIVADLRESDFVRCFWIIDDTSRKDAWDMLVEALCVGANKERVSELAEKWNCNDKDALIYCNVIGVIPEKDGNVWCVHLRSFKNLQESPCGFGDTILDSLSQLCKNLKFSYTKLNWHSRFYELCKEYTNHAHD